MPLTFTFLGQQLPSQVVWTVQFNTTHGGYTPIGENTTCFASGTAPGCGYDSLNVGAKSYDNAPYAGGDVSSDEAYVSTGNSTWAPPLVPLTTDTGWTLYRPLAEIVLGS